MMCEPVIIFWLLRPTVLRADIESKSEIRPDSGPRRIERKGAVRPPSNEEGQEAFRAELFDKVLIARRRLFVKHNQPIFSGRSLGIVVVLKNLSECLPDGFRRADTQANLQFGENWPALPSESYVNLFFLLYGIDSELTGQPAAKFV